MSTENFGSQTPQEAQVPPAPGPLADQPQAPVLDSGRVQFESAMDLLVSSTWRWAMATLFLFPILGFWSLPAAARVNAKLARGDHMEAAADAVTVKKLGLAAVVVFVVLVLLWLIAVVATAASVS